MTPGFRIPLSCLTLLPTIFLLPVSSAGQAQQTSAADTIAFILKQNKKPTEQCEALYKLGAFYFTTGQAENAFLVMNQSKSVAEKHDYDKGMYDAHSIIAAYYLKKGDSEKARAIANESLKLANRNRSEYGANRAYYILILLWYQQLKYDSVILISELVLEGPHEEYDSVSLPKINALLGNAYMAKGDLQRAGKCFLDVMAIAEKTNNEPLYAVCLGNLALINVELKNYREALKYQHKAEAIARKNNQFQSVGNLNNSIGSCYRSLMLPDSALHYFKEALYWFTKFAYPEDIALAHSNIGATYSDLAHFDSSLYYLQLAKKEFNDLKDTLNIAGNAMVLGGVWNVMGLPKKDRVYLQRALDELEVCQRIVEQKGVREMRRSCYYQQAVAYEALGNDAQSFLYLKLYTRVNDSLLSQQHIQQIAEMQTKYETEKKETEIGKLNAEKQLDVEKIARQKVVNYSLMSMAALILLSGSLIFRNVQKKRTAEKHVAILEKQNAIESMRNKIASDVHDEMGANLTRLGLNAQQLLQSPMVPEKEKQLTEKMALQSKEIITGMREIIWASNPANDNLKSMLGFMRQYIDRFFDGTQIRSVVNFPHDVGEVTLHPEVRRNLFLILKESLNNALKYSGSDRIDIDFHTENEKFQFKVTDYGKGLEDEKKNDFSSGLRNMQMRAEQIQSLFKLISAPGQGVEIIVEGNLY
ncbi:MAG TPA: tetratricopeptide repeat protein [Saprospiraceae bacterium]|nr:tetratricopeptide repeat protein [Saprospiraceae bacterium]